MHEAGSPELGTCRPVRGLRPGRQEEDPANHRAVSQPRVREPLFRMEGVWIPTAQQAEWPRGLACCASSTQGHTEERPSTLLTLHPYPGVLAPALSDPTGSGAFLLLLPVSSLCGGNTPTSFVSD